MLSAWKQFLSITKDGETKQNPAGLWVKGQRWENVDAELARICKTSDISELCKKEFQNRYGPIEIFAFIR